MKNTQGKVIVARFTAKPGNAEAMKKILNACVDPSRREPGCHDYHLYQSVEDENIFLFHEIWEDDTAITRHASQPHFLQLTADSNPLLQQPAEVTIFSPPAPK